MLADIITSIALIGIAVSGFLLGANPSPKKDISVLATVMILSLVVVGLRILSVIFSPNEKRERTNYYDQQ